MNKQQVKGNWQELKGKVKQKWAKLTDDDIMAAEGNMEELAGRLQSTYGYSKERAQQEFETFRRDNNLN